MRALVGDKEEERLFLVALNEIYRGIRDQVGHVPFAIHRQTTLKQDVQVA